MEGYKLAYDVWYYTKLYQEWNKMRQSFSTLELAKEVHKEMLKHPEVEDAMVTKTETSMFSWLSDKKESSFTQYSVILPE